MRTVKMIDLVCPICQASFKRRSYRVRLSGSECPVCLIKAAGRRRERPIKSNRHEIREGHAVVFTSKEEEILCDISDLDYLLQFTWHVDRSGITPYAKANIGERGKRKPHRLHLLLLPSREGFIIDHINGNSLDNRRCNLRYATHAQNICNSKVYGNNNSGFKGVYSCGLKWRSQIRSNGKLHELGLYYTKEEAALAYNKAAQELHGEYAKLNVL